MRIKKLEIAGFKSFSDRIEMEFPGGVTAVVGPNGCGKSNVVDAIRWALGEQSPKQLRGKSMEDFIFNGSEHRKPQGMAEVTLTFSNLNGHRLPDHLNFSEIAVTRRIFRSGESEYFINQVPCRLKDITDLFLGTGVGHRAYSIVEQGKMEFILNAKPEERRILIEEAAGVTKYRERKAAALRKMEATQQNLLRLGDVIGEIKRQLNSLNRQAKKAERFKGIREELRQIEIGQAAQTYRTLSEEYQNLQATLKNLEDLEFQATAAIREMEASLEHLRIKVLELEQELSEAQKHLTDLEGAIRNRENQIELAAREKESLLKQTVRMEEEIGKLSQQQAEAAQEMRAYEEGQRELDERIAAAENLYAEKERILEEKKNQYHQTEGSLAQEKNRLIALLTQLAKFQNLTLDLRRRGEEITRRREKTSQEIESTGRKIQEIQGRIDAQMSRLENQKVSRAQKIREREAQAAQAKKLEAALEELEKNLSAQRERLHLHQSRLNSLLELQKNFEGYQEGVRAILLKRQSEDPGPNGIRGLVEDIFEVEPKYECAVESVLGERLQHIIVQDHGETMKAIEYLKSRGSGRSGFIPLSPKQPPAPSSPPPPGEGVLPLMKVVHVKEEFLPLAAILFEDVWIVQDLRQALDLWTRDSFWKTLVTLDGEVLQPSGILTGGSKAQIGSGTFHRKREIRELTRLTERIRKEVAALEAQQEQMASGLKALEASVETLTQALHQEDLQILGATKEIDQHQMELRQLKQKIETLNLEESELEAEAKAIDRQIQDHETQGQDLERAKTQMESDLERKEKDLQDRKAEIEDILAIATEARVQLSALQEKRQNLAQNWERSRRIQQETEALIRRHRAEMEENLFVVKANEEQIQRATGELQQLLLARQERLAQLEEKKQILLEEKRKIDEGESTWKDRREALQQLRSQKNEISMKRMEIELKRNHLRSNVEEKYHLGPSALEMLGNGQDYFTPEVEARIQELKSQIEAIGEVNLLAISEYDEAKARLDFLTEQESDLVKSLEALDQAIKKMNRTTRKRFAATFEAVNQKFQEVFVELFNGGRAQLVLTDEANLLETGVEIIAQPPGKKLQNVSLLSGGEKALTAVALIFALFLINPSPFCLMDEVDAPLDDANIGRFNRMLRELAEKYQIIVVTHNKRTMEIAETLYGITMAEPGVSKLVSVKFN
jgi:chromosome segregation protein